MSVGYPISSLILEMCQSSLFFFFFSLSQWLEVFQIYQSSQRTHVHFSDILYCLLLISLLFLLFISFSCFGLILLLLIFFFFFFGMGKILSSLDYSLFKEATPGPPLVLGNWECGPRIPGVGSSSRMEATSPVAFLFHFSEPSMGGPHMSSRGQASTEPGEVGEIDESVPSPALSCAWWRWQGNGIRGCAFGRGDFSLLSPEILQFGHCSSRTTENQFSIEFITVLLLFFLWVERLYLKMSS